MYRKLAILVTAFPLLGLAQDAPEPKKAPALMPFLPLPSPYMLLLAQEAPEPKKAPAVPPQQAADEQLLKNAGIKTDPADLLDFFRKRTLPENERPKIQALIRQLGAESYRVREHAMQELINHGPVVSEVVREAVKDPDLEISSRAEKVLARIQEKDVAIEVPSAAARMLGVRKPADAVVTLYDFLPFADNDGVIDQVRDVLSQLATEGGKPHPVLVKGLEDKIALRRAIAGEALCKANVAGQKDAVRKLLQDKEPFVRLRIGLALAYAKDPAAIPALIDVLPHLPVSQAWAAEDVLYRLGEGKNPPSISLGHDEPTRKKCRDAWLAWWEKEGKTIDLARLSETPPLLGFTLVVLLDEGRVMELTGDNKTRWQVGGLVFPLDAQVLPGGERVLVAEYHAQRVTERNLKGEIVWQRQVNGPLVAQRLANGNTFIATDAELIEVDRDNKQVMSVSMPNGERVMKAMKLPNSEIAVLTSEARIVRMDSTGKELSSFVIDIGVRLFGGRIHMQSNGRVLVPHNGENKVVEYDARGKAIWEVSVDQPIAATRLPNGNTIVTTMLPARGAIEFDRAGNEVWSFRAATRVTRAMRR